MDNRALRHVFGRDRTSPDIDSFSNFHFDTAFQPLPPPTGPYPFRLDLEDVLGRESSNKVASAGKMVFHCVGDTGNAKYGAEAQDSVAEHMEQQVAKHKGKDDQPLFFYHLGDAVYYNGARDKYDEQFYDPYMHYQPPIMAIPGNHDGATPPPGDYSLQGFVENFCAAQPTHTEMAGHSHRTTMIQPNVYWTFKTPLATIIGLYSNVPGRLDKGSTTQEDWLVAELQAAKNDPCVIVAVHHPPYSLDDTHGSHPPIQASLDRAFTAADKMPTAVFAGHVHNYQRFTRKKNGRKIPYVVAGAGGFAGYSKLHQLKAGVTSGIPVEKRNDEPFVGEVIWTEGR